MSVAAYVTYHLFNIDGAGYQPYYQVAQMGMEFSGGFWKQNEIYFGYLIGDSNKVRDTVKALSPWRVDQLTEAEALAWSEAAQPVDTQTEEPEGGIQYIGPAGLDTNGFVVRPLSSTPWGA